MAIGRSHLEIFARIHAVLYVIFWAFCILWHEWSESVLPKRHGMPPSSPRQTLAMADWVLIFCACSGLAAIPLAFYVGAWTLWITLGLYYGPILMFALLAGLMNIISSSSHGP